VEQHPFPGCATRFAIVDLRSPAGDCTLPDKERSRWKVVPRRSRNPTLGITPITPWKVTALTNGFCVYQWAGDNAPSEQAFRDINATPECALAAAMQGPPQTLDLAPLVKAFDRQARGMAGNLPALAHLSPLPMRAPEVAVVDASPFGLTKPDTSEHGFGVSHIIANLACLSPDSPGCGKIVTPYLALPLVKDASGHFVDNPSGGYVGYFHHLFEAFADALDNRSPNRNLIINLSLGWDPIKTKQKGPEVQQMTTLLERAYCEGALVVASSGNATGTEGPLLPAAIETDAVPDAARCAKLQLPKPPHSKLPKLYQPYYAPLIHAVGGVDLRDERLAISRPWSQPRLSAYGEAVTTPADTATGFTTPLSGTSASAAVASGIAAAVWTVRPELTAHDVMSLVYMGGRRLDGASGNVRSRIEVCLGDPKDRCGKWIVRRASLCGAMNEALPKAHFKCVDPSSPLPANVFGPEPSMPPNTPPPVGPCLVSGCGLMAGPMANQLPEGVLPQPPVTTCPGCELSRNYQNSGIGAVYGTATSVPSNQYYTVVRTYDPSYTHPQDFPGPTPLLNQPFFESLNVASNTASAILIFYYSVDGVIWSTENDPLRVR